MDRIGSLCAVCHSDCRQVPHALCATTDLAVRVVGRSKLGAHYECPVRVQPVDGCIPLASYEASYLAGADSSIEVQPEVDTRFLSGILLFFASHVRVVCQL